MDYFWCNLFDYFKERRIAGMFFGILLVVVVLLLAGALLYQTLGPDKFWHGVVLSSPVVVAVFCVWVWRAIAQARARRRDRYKISPLSRDELRKARSKLKPAQR